MQFKKVVILLMVLLNLSLEDTTYAADTKKTRYGGTLHLGFYTKPTAINPVLTNQGISMLVMNLVFSRLVRTNSHGEIEPELAESWDISQDKKIYTFFLKRNIRFHDGVELTAEDVVFTYQSIMTPDNASPYAANYSLVENIEALGKYTLRIFLKEPQVSFLSELEREIMPKHLYIRKNDIFQSPSNYSPVGTGPFVFKKWYSDNSIVLTANEDYFEGRPYLNGIVIKTYEDAEALWNDFMKQKIDVNLFMTPKDYLWTQQDGSFNIFSNPTPYYYNITYNFRSEIVSDLLVRRAIAYGINGKELIANAEQGFGIEANGPFLKNSWAYNPNVKVYSYDPEKSIDFLKAAGWVPDDRGIFMKHGKNLEIKLLVDARNEKHQKIAMILRQQFSQIGIILKVIHFDDKSSFDSLGENADALLNFDSGGPDPNHVLKTFHSQQTAKNKRWVLNSLSGKIDKLIESGQTTDDKETKRKVYQDLHELVYTNQLRCFLYFPYVLHAANKNLKNIDLYLNENMPTYLLKEVYLQEN